METISEKIVAGLPVPQSGNKLHYFSGATLQGKKAPSGFAVRVTSAGTKAFVWFHRVDGRPHLETLGRWDENAKGGSLTVRDAIVAAQKRSKEVRDGGAGVDPRPDRTRRLEEGDRPAGETISGLLDKFVSRYVEKDAELRSAAQIKNAFDRLVKPRIGATGVYALRRSNVADMLDEIADENGPVMADRVLAYVRKAFNWYATRDGDFNTPIVKGMAKTKPKDRQRERVLADDEIRDLWAALETFDEPACYPAFIKTLLLTATRRNESSMMHSAEIDGDLWVIPAARYKTKLDHAIPLTASVLKLIGPTLPAKKKKPRFIFSTTDGTKPFSGFSKAKVALDKAIAGVRKKAGHKPIVAWTLHDLRRTARSLMGRAGVPTDHAERALGHVMAGVRGVYDRHKYIDEKKAAFEALATLVEKILNPKSNVEQLAARRAAER